MTNVAVITSRTMCSARKMLSGMTGRSEVVSIVAAGGGGRGLVTRNGTNISSLDWELRRITEMGENQIRYFKAFYKLYINIMIMRVSQNSYSHFRQGWR